MSTPDLSIIILNWNAAADTIRCVRAFANWQTIRPEIWVVDNASEDNSAELIAKTCPNVRLIKNSINLGYTGGNNQGLQKALSHSHAPLMLFNNDATIAEADVCQLLETLQNNPEVGIIGPPLFDADQPDRLLTAGGKNMIRHLSSHISEIKTDEVLQIVDYNPGTVFIARSEVFESVGLLDENYFFGGELPDFCHRAKQSGYLSAVHTGTRAYHTLARSSRFRETLYPYYIIRNRFIFIYKFYTVSKIVWLSFWTLYSAMLFLKLRLSHQTHAAQAVWMGLVDGLQQKFGGQNERVLFAGKAVPGKPGSQQKRQ